MGGWTRNDQRFEAAMRPRPDIERRDNRVGPNVGIVRNIVVPLFAVITESAQGLRSAMLLVAFLWCCLGLEAQAQQPQLSREAMGDALDGFATISGGWWLNRKCPRLAEELRKEFEWHVAGVNQRLQREGGTARVLAIQRAAKAEVEERDCNEESGRIVEGAVLLARRLNQALNGAVYVPGKSDLIYQAQRFLSLSAATGVALRCAFGPIEPREQFGQLVEAIGQKLSRDLGNEELAKKGTEIRERFRKQDLPPCDPSTERKVEAAVLGRTRAWKRPWALTSSIRPD